MSFLYLVCRIVQSSIDELSSAKTVSPEENNQQGGVHPSTSDMVEDTLVTAEAKVVVDDVVPESKIVKAPKAGAKASKEAIEMWKENGFSR